jgi:MFS family permease
VGPVLDFFTQDGKLILASRALRGVTYGFVSVLLATYLQVLEADEVTIGVVLGIALASGAGLNILASRHADRWGRRRFLALSGVLMFGSGLVLATTGSVAGAVLAALMGALTPTAMEVGPFLSVEQAILPQVSTSEGRSQAYAWYNLAGSFAAALGALLTGLATVLTTLVGNDPLAGYHLMFLGYGAAGLAAAAVALMLSPAVEPQAESGGPVAPLSPEGRKVVTRLALLFGVDSFAGGMIIRTFTAIWFTVTFSPSLEMLGLVFFAANTLQGVSFLVAARVAAQLGLVRTMVYTHIPSNLLLVALPFSPTFAVAVAVFLARMGLGSMDVAPRQEFVVTVVAPQERLAAASLTNTSRNVTQAGGPFALGPLVALAGLGAPFAIAGVIKIVYDVALLRTFGGALPSTVTVLESSK